MLVMLLLCLFTLSLCWLMLDQVGSRWFVLVVEVCPSGPQDASMLAQAGFKMSQMAFQGFQNVKGEMSSIFRTKSVRFGTPTSFWKIEIIICFLILFAIFFLGICFSRFLWGL